MLVNCPKCGFSQPKDRYCAQCGVDMLAFKPQEPSSLSKLFSSGTFQIILLIVFAVGAGTFIVKERGEQRWVQKVARSQGVTRNTDISSNASSEMNPSSSNESTNSQNDISLSNLENQSIEIGNSSQNLPNNTASAAPPSPTQTLKVTKASVSTAATDLNSANIKLSYIEIPTEILNRWEADSSRLGLFQNLGEYSAGILTEFRKRTDLNFQTLKNFERKLSPGQSDTSLSGTMSDDGTRMVGLATKIDLRSIDNGAIHGTITVTRTAKQSRENYPAEFDLPKGAVFFLIGSIKRQQFAAEMNQLTMPPFQILHSNDFRMQKTEFVIVVEPEFR